MTSSLIKLATCLALTHSCMGCVEVTCRPSYTSALQRMATVMGHSEMLSSVRAICTVHTRVSSTGGGGSGEASPPNSLASPPKEEIDYIITS